ncbi:mediator of RNA polymerase II transcription subunit 29-like [Clavelina lepadiformis]|uniref:Mediator of RNA polymerase II transcription subunit 29 n=1 Tax=Clavelina lepadiformis TaxID=159417 RepID=A0ABP0FP83_CLALP
MKRIRIQGVAGISPNQNPTVNVVQRPPGIVNPVTIHPSSMRMQRPPQQQQQPSAQPEPYDPIAQVKVILPQLKESLVNLMTVGSKNFAGNRAVDDMQKGLDSSNIPPFNKCLENFYTLCDQLEIQLNLGQQQLSQTLVGIHNTPLMTGSIKSDVKDPQVYANYVNIVENQVRCTKEIHELLANCCRTLSEQQVKYPTG